MSVKRKISVRKIIQALLTLVLAGVCITAVSSATRLHKARKLDEVDISIKNKQYGFVTQDEVKSTLLRDGEIREKETKVSLLNVKQMEQVLTANPWVKDAQVYIDNSSKLHALVTQRVPVVRIFEGDGNSYYLDRDNEPLPLSSKYSQYTMVVTNVPELKGDSASEALKAQILTLTSFIRQDSFWNAQVSQVIVRDDMRFEIVPVLGEQTIIVGDTTDLQKKFNNLFTFYTKVLNKIGWDRYEVLDLSYKGQLVASPAINWKLPEDKTIRRINWVKSILGEDVHYQTFNNSVPVAPKVEPAVHEAAVPQPVQEQDIEAEVTEGEKQEEAQQAELAEQLQQVIKQDKPTTKKQNKKETEDKKPKYIYNGN